VAEAYGVKQAFAWGVDKELTSEQQVLNSKALIVLRSCLTERVLQVLMAGKVERASAMLASLKKMFLAHDARSKVEVQRKIHACDQALGESLLDFLHRIGGLMSELQAKGEVISEEWRIVTVVSRLRQPLRQVADDYMDRHRDHTFEDLVSFLMMKTEMDLHRDAPGEAYVATSSDF
jgi:gag-polypeptide of LTR copia-type